MKIYICGIFIFIICCVSCTTIRNNPVGARVYHFQDKARMDWRYNDKPRPLNTMIWYPAQENTFEKEHSIAIFNAGIFAFNARIKKSDTRYPLIILSHGTGGSAVSMAWLAESLAQNGYIVAAINHHGNTGVEPKYLLPGFILWWERAKDISRVIDCILNDDLLGSVIDLARIGVAGFSLGGYSALAVSGANLQLEKWDKISKTEGNNSIKSMPPESKFTMEDVHNFIMNDSIAIESIAHANDNYLDARIKAAFVIAPVLVPLMDINSLYSIKIPIDIITSDQDKQCVLNENGLPLSQYIMNPKLIILNGVGHYTFLSEGNTFGKIFAQQYTKDSKGIDRNQVHQYVAKEALAFFNDNL